jgi:hypothetical protein
VFPITSLVFQVTTVKEVCHESLMCIFFCLPVITILSYPSNLGDLYKLYSTSVCDLHCTYIPSTTEPPPLYYPTNTSDLYNYTVSSCVISVLATLTGHFSLQHITVHTKPNNHYKSDSSSLCHIHHTYIHSSLYPCISLLSQ